MPVSRLRRVTTTLLVVGALAASALVTSPDVGVAAKGTRVFQGPVAKADCGPGSAPETALQGQVPRADRDSGRSQKAYTCNMELVGQHQGVGSGWQFAWQDHCAYYDTYSQSGEGVAVLDVSKPRQPQLATKLTTPAMLGPWESLKVNAKRELLAGVAAYSPVGSGPLFFDVYDVSEDCADPQLLASLPLNVPIGHEGNWAQDGKTYYGASTYTSHITAIDVSDPAAPEQVAVIEQQTHGLSTSADGKRLYLTGPSCGNGLKIVDVSEIQAREPDPQSTVLGEVCWTDGGTAQHTIPVTIKGHPYIIFVDEGGSEGIGPCCAGAARLIDIGDETKPRVVSKFKLEISMPRYREQAVEDAAGNGLFGYQFHYCNVDRLIEPTVLGCGAFQSGVRVIDIRDPFAPREIAYFNPPAQSDKKAQLRGSEHAANPANSSADLTADWCSAQVRFVPERRQLWTTCQDNGLLIFKFTNGVWPFGQHRRQAGPESSSG